MNGQDVCVHEVSDGYRHEFVSINGNPAQSYGAWPDVNPFWGNWDVQNPDYDRNKIGKPGTRTMCYQSTPEQDRQVEDWIRSNYDVNGNPKNNPPYIFGYSDCRHFVGNVLDYLYSIQGNPQQGGGEGTGGGVGGFGG